MGVYDFDTFLIGNDTTSSFLKNLTVLCSHDVIMFSFVTIAAQGDLFSAETKKKEAIPDLRICNFLRSEVQFVILLCQSFNIFMLYCVHTVVHV